MTLLIIGYILCAVGSIWLLVMAFQESIGWGLARVLIPFAALIFVIMYWSQAQKPFLVQVLGAVSAILGTIMTGTSL